MTNPIKDHPLLIEDDYVWFTVDIEELEEYYAKFICYSVTSWNDDKTIFEKEKYLSGMIKWDGCSHINFGYEGYSNGYIHLCGKHSWEQHIKVMKNLYQYISSQIKGFDDEVIE